MQGTLGKWWCRAGFHKPEVEYRSAPGLFEIDGKVHRLIGMVERCERPGCRAFMFSVEGGPRTICHPKMEPRRYSSTEREGRVLVLA